MSSWWCGKDAHYLFCSGVTEDGLSCDTSQPFEGGKGIQANPQVGFEIDDLTKVIVIGNVNASQLVNITLFSERDCQGFSIDKDFVGSFEGHSFSSLRVSTGHAAILDSYVHYGEMLVVGEEATDMPKESYICVNPEDRGWDPIIFGWEVRNV